MSPNELVADAKQWLFRSADWMSRALARSDWLKGLYVQSQWIRLTRPTVRIAGLGRAWHGARIAVLSDLHVGRICGMDDVRRAVAASNDCAPDLVALTGDLADRPEAVTADLAAALAELSAPAGKFAVLGNHDYNAGPAELEACLREAGVRLLTNARATLHRAGQALCIAGVDDLNRGRADAAAALAGADARTPTILLSHNPDYGERLPAGCRVDLMLCGHTHGGQIRLPFGPAPLASVRYKKYTEGMVRGRRCPVYVSRGLGRVYLPFRLNCRPELPVLTLERA